MGISETEAVNEAIAMSLSEFKTLMNLKGSMTMSDAKCCDSSCWKMLTGNPRMIVVSRLRIWQTAKTYFKRKSFMSKTGPLKVTFATSLEEEDAIDHGGPRREFLHLLLGAICNGSSTLTSMLTMGNDVCVKNLVNFVTKQMLLYCRCFSIKSGFTWSHHKIIKA